MSYLLFSERLEEQLFKFFFGIFVFYKKYLEIFYLFKSLGQIFEVVVSVSSCMLEIQLDVFLVVLYFQICVFVEFLSFFVMSNQKEVLCCFIVLVCSLFDCLLVFLLFRLDISNERICVGILQVVRYVINLVVVQMEDKKFFIFFFMRFFFLDINSKVKWVVVQVISVMVYYGYLEQFGGEVMIEYIVQQCVLFFEQEFEKLGFSSKDFRVDSVWVISVCIFYLVSIIVDRMSYVFWLYLF